MEKRVSSFVKWGMGALALAVGPAYAAANGSVDGETGAYVISVSGADVTLSAEDVAALGTNVDLVKRGAGRLIINTNLKAAKWAGELRVEEGYLRVKALGPFGTATKGTIVSDGATLEVDGSAVGANQNDFLTGEPITITGKGVKVGDEYMGVVRNVANSQYPGMTPVTMLGDCLYATAKASDYRLDFRNGTFNMNGYTLTTRGYFALTGVSLQNPGNIVVEQGVFDIEGNTRLNGDSANRLTIGAGAYLYFQGARNPMAWTLELNNGSTVQAVSTGTNPDYNTWTGPVELVSGKAKIYSDYRYTPIKLTGNITGAGGIDATGTSGATLKLLGTANTFTGGLTISGSAGIVYAPTPGAVPHGETDGAIELKGANAALCAYVGDDAETEGAWSSAEYQALKAKTATTGAGSAVVMWNEAGQTKTFAEDVTTNIGIGHGGTGTLALGGDWTTGDFINLGGGVTMTEGEQMHVRFFDLVGGTMTIPNGALVYCHTNAYIGAAWPDTAKIVVENGGCLMTSNASPSGVYYMAMGRARGATDKYYRGIIDLHDGACMTGRICVGYAQGAKDAAALYVREGASFRSFGTGGSCDMYNGSGGSGYVELAGSMYMPGWTIFGNGGWGRGVWVQKGGTAQMAGDAFALGAGGGRGEAYFCGGTFTSARDIQVGKSVWATTGKGSHAVLTVAGNATVTCDGAIDLAMQTNSYAALNLLGGVLQTKIVQKMTNVNHVLNTSKGNQTFQEYPGNSAFVNFNGGTLRAAQAGELFPVAPDRVNVFSHGATIDTAGKDCSVSVPLAAPTGKGVASIPLPPSFSVPWNYIGSPYITIEGDGTNAWAHAVFDSESGLVTGIEIVSPGCNYTWAKATIEYAGWTNRVVVDNLPLADNVTGGFTKKGAGALTLAAANSFTGPVVVEGGTLRAGNEHALPSSTFDLSVTGGTLDGGGRTWTFGAITATSGGVMNVSSASTAASLTKTGPGTFDLDSSLSIGSAIKVEEGTLILPQAGPGLWEAAHTHPTSTVRIAEYDLSPIYKEAVSTSLAYLYTNHQVASSPWKDHMNVFYSGYIWNTNETDQTWCIAGVLDDGVKVVIDGKQVIAATGWTAPKFGKVTVSPGAHQIYIAAYNGTGGAGATGAGTYYAWPAKHGLVWNPEGAFNADRTVSTNFYDYVDFVNPTNGAVLSLSAEGYEPVVDVKPMAIEVAAGATVFVGDGAYAFTSYKGLGSISGSTSIQSWIIDGAEVAAGGKMHVTGNLAFPAGATFELEHVAALPTTGAAMVIATVDGEVTGTLPAVAIPGSGTWSVFRSGHDLKLGLNKGTVLIFR